MDWYEKYKWYQFWRIGWWNLEKNPFVAIAAVAFLSFWIDVAFLGPILFSVLR